MTPYVDSYRMFGCPLCSFGINLQLLLETADPALPHQLLGYNPAAISHSDAAETQRITLRFVARQDLLSLLHGHQQARGRSTSE